MNEYFYSIIKNLDLNDLTVLGTMGDNNSTFAFKGKTFSQLEQETDLTIFKLKQTLTRLQCLLFVKSTISDKTKTFFLTELGELAIQKSLEGEL